MSERAYTANDIARMRAATEILVFENRHHFGGYTNADRILERLAHNQILEERIRTAIAAGLSPEDIESEADARALTMIKHEILNNSSFCTIYRQWAYDRKIEIVIDRREASS